MAKAPRPTLRFIDRFVLLVAWLVTCGLVFVLGYYVGRGAPDRSGAMEERTVRLPVTSTPPPEGQRPKASKDFPSFYQALPSGERPIDVARGTPVTAPAGGDAPAPAPRPTTTTLAPRAAVAEDPHRAPTTTTVPRPQATTTTVPRPAPGTTLVPSTIAPAPSAPPTTTTVPRPAARGGFTVEASPTRSRAEAEELLATLRRRGYDASLVQMQRDGDTWYRLRVGRYATAQQAADAMRKLRESEGVSHAFVAAE
jgi:cell division septation protein DedD